MRAEFRTLRAKQLARAFDLQLRLDIFNLANHTNFGVPNAALFTGIDSSGSAVANPAAGLITTTSTTPRQLQLSAKFSF